MNLSYLDWTLGDLACSIPGATRIFHGHRLDFCCGGQKSLRDAAQRKGLDAEAIATELAALLAQGNGEQDWRDAPNEKLIAHILERYHERHRDQLPELIRLAARVEHVHGDRSDCPHGLTEHLRVMQQELESHMLKEEQVLFPMLLSGFGIQAGGPISVMRFEHDQHGEALEHLLELTDQITPPPGACNTWQALYRGLDELRNDLMQHIHLENNILFVQAMQPQESNHG
ncbi:Iron-sulfur cluster repair protein YtfE [compost metagenome]